MEERRVWWQGKANGNVTVVFPEMGVLASGSPQIQHRDAETQSFIGDSVIG